MMIGGLLLVTSCVSTLKKVQPPKKPENNPLLIPFNNNFDFKNIKPGHITPVKKFVMRE